MLQVSDNLWFFIESSMVNIWFSIGIVAKYLLLLIINQRSSLADDLTLAI